MIVSKDRRARKRNWVRWTWDETRGIDRDGIDYFEEKEEGGKADC